MLNIISVIESNPLPGPLVDWWKAQAAFTLGLKLDPEEIEYINFYTSSECPANHQMPYGVVYPNALVDEEKEKAKEMYGDQGNAYPFYANRATRQRILKHHVLRHPLMVQYYGTFYRLLRDLNPAHATAERVYQVGTGEEMFTGIKVSRAWAAVELMLPIIVGRIFRICLQIKFGAAGVKPPTLKQRLQEVKANPPVTPPNTRWELPPRGGKMINGRWYTEHALERMAPDTPQVRAIIAQRIPARLRKLGIMPDSPIHKACCQVYISKIHPRGVPPMVVEAEILNPGSIPGVKVITAKEGKVVVTVITDGGAKLEGLPVPQGKVPIGNKGPFAKP